MNPSFLWHYNIINLKQALSYFHREIYSVCYVAAVSWPFFYGQAFVQKNKFLIANWAVGCILLSFVTLLPAIKVEDSNTV